MGVGVRVGVGEEVLVGVGVGIEVLVGVGVGVEVLVGVGVGVTGLKHSGKVKTPTRVFHVEEALEG